MSRRWSENKFCANCLKRFDRGNGLNCPTGESSLYNPGEQGIILCEPCFFWEDDLIEKEGRNDLPDVLARYRKNLETHG